MSTGCEPRSPKNLSEKALGNEGATTNLLLRNDEIVPLCDALLWVPVGKVTNCANISLTSEGARAPIWIAVADYLKNLPRALFSTFHRLAALQATCSKPIGTQMVRT